MTTALTPTPKQQFFTAGGVPLVAGKLYTYAAGTSTPLATYQDSTGTVSNTNPIILNSRGEANIWLAPSLSYKFVLRDSADALIWTVDNINLGINFANVIITGGTINGVTIGNITPGSGAFTTLRASGEVTFNGSGQMQIPAGTTANRSATPTEGMIRYNTTTDQYEGNKSVAGQTISSITSVGTLATLTTSTPHGLLTGDYVTISGVTPSNYNSSYIITVTGATTFQYTMVSSPGSSATVLGSYVAFLWQQIGGGATGSGDDQVFVENDQTVTISYTIPAGKNAMTTGPITLNSGVTVTVPSGGRWVVL
jgi:hypothetical protein